MTEDVLKGKWRQLKGEVRKRWGELTEDDVEEIRGEREKLIGKIQERYGYTRARAENEVNDYMFKMQAEM